MKSIQTRRWSRRLGAVALWFSLPFIPGNGYAASTQFGDLNSSFRVIWGLLVVLGIILLLYGLLKKKFSLLAHSPQQQIRIVEIKPLMGRKALCLIEVRGQEYLLGISGDRISPIAAIPPKPVPSFADSLKNSGTDPLP